MKRNLMFLFGCILFRYFLTYLAKVSDDNGLFVLGLLFAIISIGMFSIFLTKSRKTGAETLGADIWWNDYRPIHASLYALFSYMALSGNHDAWKILFADTTLGLGLFVLNRTGYIPGC
jgi:hypothetical protein